jgi:hypothetical protein
VKVPRPDGPDYARAVHRELARRPYAGVLPASDQALVQLDPESGRFLDKSVLAGLAREAGVPTPSSMMFDSPSEVVAAGRRLSYPAVAKPAVTRGSSVLLRRPEDIRKVRWAGDEPIVVQPFLSGTCSSVGGVMWRGRLVAAVHQRHLRHWPEVCGNVCAAVTVRPDPRVESGLERLMEGFGGIFQAQFIGPYLIDVHPRIYASHPLAEAAGANLVAVYCALLRGAEVAWIRGRPGVRYRWTRGDVSFVVAGLRAGELSWVEGARMLAPHGGTAHSMESLSDPGPMLVRFRHNAQRSLTRRLRRPADPVG